MDNVKKGTMITAFAATLFGTYSIFAKSAFRLNKDEVVVQLARCAAEALGLKVQVIASGGGSDANYFNHRGIKAINLRIGRSKVHTKEELIKIKDLVMTAYYVVAIVEKACESVK